MFSVLGASEVLWAAGKGHLSSGVTDCLLSQSTSAEQPCPPCARLPGDFASSSGTWSQSCTLVDNYFLGLVVSLPCINAGIHFCIIVAETGWNEPALVSVFKEGLWESPWWDSYPRTTSYSGGAYFSGYGCISKMNSVYTVGNQDTSSNLHFHANSTCSVEHTDEPDLCLSWLF